MVSCVFMRIVAIGGNLGSHSDGTCGVGFGRLDVEEVVVPRESQGRGVLTCYV